MDELIKQRLIKSMPVGKIIAKGIEGAEKGDDVLSVSEKQRIKCSMPTGKLIVKSIEAMIKGENLSMANADMERIAKSMPVGKVIAESMCSINETNEKQNIPRADSTSKNPVKISITGKDSINKEEVSQYTVDFEPVGVIDSVNWSLEKNENKIIEIDVEQETSINIRGLNAGQVTLKATGKDRADVVATKDIQVIDNSAPIPPEDNQD